MCIRDSHHIVHQPGKKPDADARHNTDKRSKQTAITQDQLPQSCLLYTSAETLLRLWRTYGVAVFKLDGVKLRTPAARAKDVYKRQQEAYSVRVSRPA